MARVAMTGTAAADPAADGAGAQAPATVGPPGMRRGRPWNSSDRAHMQDCLIAARLAGVSQLRYEVPGYGTATFDLKHEKAAGDREPVQAAERSFVERTAPRKEELTEEQKDARAAARRAKKARQKANKAERKAAAASEEERAECPHAQLRENVELVMDGLEAATQAGGAQPQRVQYSGRLLAASRGGQRVRRPGVRHGPSGLRGDQGRPGLARQRALRAVPGRQN